MTVLLSFEEKTDDARACAQSGHCPFNLFEEERISIMAFPGFEPPHLCDQSDQRRLQVEGLAVCATATQGSSEYEK